MESDGRGSFAAIKANFNTCLPRLGSRWTAFARNQQLIAWLLLNIHHFPYERPTGPVATAMLMLRIVQLVKGLRPSIQTNGMFVNGFFSFCTNRHFRALFVNGHRLATNSHIHEWDFVVPRFLPTGEFSLASSTGKAGTSLSINVRLPWADSILLIR